jgi:hypothetical protein
MGEFANIFARGKQFKFIHVQNPSKLVFRAVG